MAKHRTLQKVFHQNRIVGAGELIDLDTAEAIDGVTELESALPLRVNAPAVPRDEMSAADNFAASLGIDVSGRKKPPTPVPAPPGTSASVEEASRNGSI